MMCALAKGSGWRSGPFPAVKRGEPLNPKSKDAQNCAAAGYKDRIALFQGPDSVTGDIVLYPVSMYGIRQSEAEVE